MFVFELDVNKFAQAKRQGLKGGGGGGGGGGGEPWSPEISALEPGARLFHWLEP